MRLALWLGMALFCSRAGTDRALRKLAASATASSVEMNHVAAFAVDDDPGTRWSSQWSDNQWLSIDLGTWREISEIRLLWEQAYASEYALEVSNDAQEWKEIKHVSEGAGGEEVFTFDDLAAHFRGYRPREEIYERVERLLDHGWADPDDPNDLSIENHEGWTYHWVDIETGKWISSC